MFHNRLWVLHNWLHVQKSTSKHHYFNNILIILHLHLQTTSQRGFHHISHNQTSEKICNGTHKTFPHKSLQISSSKPASSSNPLIFHPLLQVNGESKKSIKGDDNVRRSPKLSRMSCLSLEFLLLNELVFWVELSSLVLKS